MMKNIKPEKKNLLLLGGFFIILTAIPFVLFLIQFKDYPLSDNQNDWADFGAFFSGFLTPIISLISLIVLVYIYMWIQQQTGKESQNLFKLQKRINAYDELMKYMPYLINLSRRLKYVKSLSENLRREKKPEEALEALKDNTQDTANWFNDFHSYLSNFHPRYGHIFAQDLNESLYKELLSQSKTIADKSNTYYFDQLTKEIDPNDDESNPFSNFDLFMDKLVGFINFLRSELYDSVEIEEIK